MGLVTDHMLECKAEFVGVDYESVFSFMIENGIRYMYIDSNGEYVNLLTYL